MHHIPDMVVQRYCKFNKTSDGLTEQAGNVVKNVSSLPVCAIRCQQRQDCRGFEFEADLQRCSLNDDPDHEITWKPCLYEGKL